MCIAARKRSEAAPTCSRNGSCRPRAPSTPEALLSARLPGAGEIIEIAPLDLMLARLERIALIKADVEGLELELLLGAERLIARDRPILYLENDRLERSEALLNHVLGLGYDVWWRVVPLFRKENFAHTAVNIFSDIRSCNILCLPRQRRAEVTGFEKVEDASLHPFRK